MRKVRYDVCITLAVLGLAGLVACSKPAATGGNASSGAPAATTATTGGSADLGQGLKVGGWEMTSHIPGMSQPMVTKMCLDAGLSTEFAKLGSSNAAQLDCTTTKTSRLGNNIDVDSVCKHQGMTINSKMHMELTDNGYHQTIEQSYDPPSMKPTTVEVDGKYLGDCGDMKPGDMVMPGGIKINMHDVAAKAKKS